MSVKVSWIAAPVLLCCTMTGAIAGAAPAAPVYTAEGKLQLAVKDTGQGLGAASAAEAGSGVGLANIRERLKTLYGEGAQLTLSENQPHGVVAAIEIPHDETGHRAAG